MVWPSALALSARSDRSLQLPIFMVTMGDPTLYTPVAQISLTVGAGIKGDCLLHFRLITRELILFQ
jgi:hypothetical protein